MNMGNPKRASRFLCLHCMKINQLGSGIQRNGNQRKKKHIKDLTCFNEGCNGEITKNVEIRWCDDYLEMFFPCVTGVWRTLTSMRRNGETSCITISSMQFSRKNLLFITTMIQRP